MRDIEELTSRLPERPGIQFKEELFNTVIMVLLVFLDGEYHFVFQKRAKRIRQGGDICFPGGVYDQDNDTSYEFTALRETCEEMGIPAENINVAGRLDTLVAPMGITVDAFVGVADIDSIDQITINKKEVEDFFTIPVSFFVDNEPEMYHVGLRSYPSYVDEKTGEEIVLLPSEELGLSDMYLNPWDCKQYNVYVYKTEHGTIWGITARFVRNVALLLKQ